MYQRQRGEISLFWLALLMAMFAAITMAALFSMRSDRNLFAEGIGWLIKSPAAATATALVEPDARPGAGALRKCVIDGKTVVSNVACADHNPTSKTMVLHDSRGVEPPRVPVPAATEAAPATLQDKMIDKATR
jgi:hypothetical protein